jgi:hypothetical protein
VELNRRLLEGYTHFKDEPRVQQLRESVLKYNRLVRDLGLRDHQVTRFLLFPFVSLIVSMRYLKLKKQAGKLLVCSYIERASC